ncbi:hypothetical protein EKO04_005015 [Ascochyta lentis]|uniref:Uncharacterized protein n=1 Tax=Ascochyta lentis TaxID=205686 RepID=A0A8H7J3D5_9PLEO|nr:hypothetical protein EKO04_005015 [Ascochyta lentis]
MCVQIPQKVKGQCATNRSIPFSVPLQRLYGEVPDAAATDQQEVNKHYEKLLANQPEPEPSATEDRSRAIRYAKEHYASHYDIRGIARIVGWLNEAEEKQASVEMTLFAAISCPLQRIHETSSP